MKKKRKNRSRRIKKKPARTISQHSDVSQVINLAIKHHKSGQLLRAEKLYRQVLTDDPNNIYANNYLGVIAHQAGHYDAAISLFNKTIDLKPNYAEPQCNLGNSYVQLRDYDKAIDAYQKAVSIDSSYVEAYYNLASSYEKINKVADARKYLEKLRQLGYHKGRSLFLEAKILYREGDSTQALERLSRGEDLPDGSDIFLSEVLFLRGKLHDEQNQTDEAFADFCKANHIQWQAFNKANIDQQNILDLVAREKRKFTENWVGTWLPYSSKKSNRPPIFLVGFPRSGTTLLDQILSSHPDIQVLEEKPLIGALVQEISLSEKGYPDALADLTKRQIDKLREKYFTCVQQSVQHNIQGKLVIDKFPLNITKIGVILRIFPDAKIILALRHPLDVCLSNFMQHYALNPAMINFLTLEKTAETYAAVMDLWLNYAKVFNINFHEIKYENVVENLEGECRKLLSFLEVGWNDQVLHYHKRVRESKKTINTPSFRDVAKPIFTRAKFRWQRYRHHLIPIMERIRPSAENFGYKID